DDMGLTITRNDSVVISIASLIGNDTDPNGDAMTISAVGNAVNGTVTLNRQNGTVIFTPTNNYSGPASFTYTLSDGRGGTDQANV
ncbi:cadherin-like domain-containing protein, partial [Rhizobium ecuadorense]